MSGRSTTILALIAEAIDREFGLTIDDLRSAVRTEEYCSARFLFCLLAREMTLLASSEIGAYMHRNHASILGGIARAKDWMTVNPAFAERARRVRAHIEAAMPEDFTGTSPSRNPPFSPLTPVKLS